jgi:hypothetical protein
VYLKARKDLMELGAAFYQLYNERTSMIDSCEIRIFGELMTYRLPVSDPIPLYICQPISGSAI